MKRRLLPLGTLTVTMCFLALLVAVNPFERTDHLLERLFGAAPEWTLVDKVYVDPQTQETSHGENPIPSFKQLSEHWNQGAAARHVYLIGNSQMYTVLLAPGEQLEGTPEKTYPDLLNDFYRSQNRRVEIYRLAAPNITYMEVLWYLVYLTQHPTLQPNTLVLQLNYETFRKTGIRDGMLGMLDEPRFADAIADIAAGARPYSNLFSMALQKRREQLAKLGNAPSTAAGGASHTGIRDSDDIGNAIETHFRNWLEHVPGFSRRGQMKGDFEGLLYRARVFFLHIKPATPRALSNATLVLNRSALEDIAQLCRSRHIQLVLINAPQNPSALLYKTAADRKLYQETIHSMTALHNLPLYDFERSIPNSFWGVWIDGPDPIHFGRHGHSLMAKIIIENEVVDEQVHALNAARSIETNASLREARRSR
jgi:hypothetical protein